jgi:hypothetical protein
MPEYHRFELRRQSDDLVYQFVLSTDAVGQLAYQRQDQNVWISRRENLGWVAWDEPTQSVMGRPWDVQPADQTNHPPEGVWVSRKGSKSYVYTLVYVS